MYLEQHVRGRSVLSNLLQTGVHKVPEIIGPERDRETETEREREQWGGRDSGREG